MVTWCKDRVESYVLDMACYVVLLCLIEVLTRQFFSRVRLCRIRRCLDNAWLTFNVPEVVRGHILAATSCCRLGTKLKGGVFVSWRAYALYRLVRRSTNAFLILVFRRVVSQSRYDCSGWSVSLTYLIGILFNGCYCFMLGCMHTAAKHWP